MRLLVVDDDSAVRSVLALALEGWAVLEAEDGRTALEVLAVHDVDALLLDVAMPALDGFTVLQRVRAEPSIAHLPVVLLTARASERDHLQGYRSGADAYLTKPFDVERLVAVLDEVVQRGPADRARARTEEISRAELLRQIEHAFD